MIEPTISLKLHNLMNDYNERYGQTKSGDVAVLQIMNAAIRCMKDLHEEEKYTAYESKTQI